MFMTRSTGRRTLAERFVHRQDGMTIVELVIAMGIFGLVATSALVVLNSSLDLTRNDRSRSVGANLAAREMDVVRSTDFASQPVGTTTTTATVDKVPYTVARVTEWINASSLSGKLPCGGVGPQGRVLRITVTVTWPQMRGTQPVQSQTILAPPAINPNSTTGAIGVSVIDRNGAPVSGRTVTVTGPSGSQTKSTGPDGCATFPTLNPGQYTTTVSDAGWVDSQGVQASSQTSTVNAASAVAVEFTYDRAGTLSLTFAGAYGGTVASGIATTVYNAGLLPSGVKTFSGTGSTRTVGSLFPYGGGYSVWGGDCADADPQAMTSDGSAQIYPGATRSAPLSVPPGTTTSGNVRLGTLNVNVRRANGTLVPGATLLLHHAAGTGCTSGEDLTAGTTDASGNLSVAVPYGLWEVRVQSQTVSGSWPSVTMTPTASAAQTATVTLINPCSAGTQTLTTTADARVSQLSPTTAQGASATTFGVRSQTTSRNARSLITFSLPAAPSGCTLTGATLRVYTTTGQTGRTLQAYRVNSNWAESTVTWNTQPTVTGTATATSSVSSGWLQWTVLGSVQAWYGGSTNYGFQVRDSVEDNSTGYTQTMSPRESGSNAAQLVLTWA